MIESFADAATADVFRGRTSRAAQRIARDVWRTAQRKLKALDVAVRLQDLAIPARDRLERLRSDPARCGFPIDDRYRITFRWEQGHAYEVRVEDHY